VEVQLVIIEASTGRVYVSGDGTGSHGTESRILASSCDADPVESPPREEGCLRHQENFGEAHLSAADRVVAHQSQSGVTENPVRSAATPPREEGTMLTQKNVLDKNKHPHA